MTLDNEVGVHPELGGARYCPNRDGFMLWEWSEKKPNTIKWTCENCRKTIVGSYMELRKR